MLDILHAEEERQRNNRSPFNPYPANLKAAAAAASAAAETASKQMAASSSMEINMLKARLADERRKNVRLRKRNTELVKKLSKYESNVDGFGDEKILSLDEIDIIVAELFGVNKKALYGTTRKHPDIFAKHAVRFVAYNCGKPYSLTTIADRYGAKDHSTVLHSFKALRNLCETGKLEADIVSELNRMCRVEKL